MAGVIRQYCTQFCRALELRLDVGGHYSTVQAVSRIVLLAAGVAVPLAFSAAAGQTQQAPAQSRAPQARAAAADPKRIFAQGEDALKRGDLDQAERSFKRVLAIDPRVAGAYANLGVIHMRRQEWTAALESLRQAEQLAPKLPGIRLNIGLAYYRQADYRHAIGPFESVVKDTPDSVQARYLLGQCYLFTDRFVEAADMLEPLWPKQSKDLVYLYVLSLSAEKADRHELSERAVQRMAEVGGDSAEVHLFLGKAMLQLEAYDDALRELTAAAEANPKLPLVHYHLGLLYSKKGDDPRARDEFLKDIALEPDVAFNYDEIGNVYFLLNDDAEAEKNYQQAVKLNPKLLTAHMGLVKVYQRQNQLEKALAQLQAAGQVDPESSRVHYLRGQILMRMGRKDEAKKELDTSVRMSSARRDRREKELEGESSDPVKPSQ
jgi:tetratricopeptide (TPR) repeat protein